MSQDHDVVGQNLEKQVTVPIRVCTSAEKQGPTGVRFPAKPQDKLDSTRQCVNSSRTSDIYRIGKQSGSSLTGDTFCGPS
jgi:hypothetical protein